MNSRKRKAIGAYYTPGDVTAYIAEMTILPWLLDSAATRCPDAFMSGGSAWQLLADNPDRYIREALRHGADRPLPRSCAAVPPPEIGLPTERWPEVSARRRRCTELRKRLHDGAVHSVNDLVTLNLDIRAFVADLLTRSGVWPLIDAVRQALRNIRVLDPTCGDGAFLVTALNLLDDVAAMCGERARDSLLRHSIFGIDLDNKAIAQCRRNLAGTAHTAKPAPNIYHGEALTLRFPEVAHFDVIVGNPPYIVADPHRRQRGWRPDPRPPRPPMNVRGGVLPSWRTSSDPSLTPDSPPSDWIARLHAHTSCNASPPLQRMQRNLIDRGYRLRLTASLRREPPTHFLGQLPWNARGRLCHDG